MNEKKSNVKKKMKIKIINDFIADKKTLNRKTFKKNKSNVQSILHRCVMNEFFKNNYRNW